MDDYTKFQKVNDQIMALGDIPDAKTHEEWLVAYKRLRDVQEAIKKMINGDTDYDVEIRIGSD